MAPPVVSGTGPLESYEARTPDAFEVAIRVARLYDLNQVVAVGDAPLWLPVSRGDIRLLHVSFGAETRRRAARYPANEAWTWNHERGDPFPISHDRLGRSVVVLHEALEHHAEPAVLLQRIKSKLSSTPIVILTLRSAGADADSIDTGHLTRFWEMLRNADLPPTFLGWTATAHTYPTKSAGLAIVDRNVGSGPSSAPYDFSVTAIITAYNEADVIAATIEGLIEDGISVYVIDNWSTDNTAEIAERYGGRGVVNVERFPPTPSAIYDWTGLLRRVEAVAASLETKWVIHHDADERRTPPWPATTLRDGLWTAERSGFNAVDHTVLNFRPIDNGFKPGTSPEHHFRNFEFGATPDLLVQVKAWKRLPGVRVDLVTSGGHDVSFPGRRVFPYKFMLKHYPIRTQAHGERKIFRDRTARWNPVERAAGWHVQYDAIEVGASFLVDPDSTSIFATSHDYQLFLAEIIAGAGLAPDMTPSWARRGRLTRVAYDVVVRSLVRSGLKRKVGRALRNLPAPLRTRLVRAKHRLLG